MSVEDVLRGIGDPSAGRLAQAWREHERRQEERHNALRLDIDKAVQRSTLSVTVAGLTLAGLLAATLYVGPELGAMRERLGAVKEQVDKIPPRLDQLDGRLQANEGLLRRIDERTKNMEQARFSPADAPEGPLQADSRAVEEKVKALAVMAEIGRTVRGPDGRSLGTIRGRVVDRPSGPVRAVLVGTDRAAGEPEARLRIDLGDLSLDAEGDIVAARWVAVPPASELEVLAPPLSGQGPARHE